MQAFPASGNKKRISNDGGGGAMWRKDGRELYFVTEDDSLMVVNVTSSAASIAVSSPARLFQARGMTLPSSGQRPSYAPGPDGQRFLTLIPVEDDHPRAIHLISNWKPGAVR